MMTKLVVLGAGTVQVLPDYGCAGYLLWWLPAEAEGSGSAGERPILIDCGSGTLDRLCGAGVTPTDIDLIMISHFHVDHVSDLAAVLLSRWLYNRKAGVEDHRITIAGPVGIEGHVSRVTKLNQPWMSEYRFDFIELAESAPFPGMRVETALTGHTPESICFRIVDESGRRFFYSGDMDYNESLIPLASDADLAIVECSMPDDRKLSGHLTPRLAGVFAQKARIRHLLLTHFYEEVLKVDIAGEVRKEYGGTVSLARQLEHYDIG